MTAAVLHLGDDKDGDEDEDGHCTPGWHSVKCLDDGTVMRGEGCASRIIQTNIKKHFREGCVTFP